MKSFAEFLVEASVPDGPLVFVAQDEMRSWNALVLRQDGEKFTVSLFTPKDINLRNLSGTPQHISSIFNLPSRSGHAETAKLINAELKALFSAGNVPGIIKKLNSYSGYRWTQRVK